MTRRVAAAALAGLLAVGAACSDATTSASSTTSRDATSPAPSATETSSSPSPIAAPVRARFAGRAEKIPAGLAREMRGTTWHAGCPVPIAGLRLLHFNYWGFDGEIKRGPMVVNASVAGDVLWVFRQLFDAKFPLKRVALAKEYKPKHEDPSRHRSVTASFNCRPVITTDGPQAMLSQHSYGLAVDVNPLQNPEVATNGYVRDRAAKIYRDRSQDLPGMIHAGDVVVRAFAAIGWKWGGDWTSMKDYMHFSETGT